MKNKRYSVLAILAALLVVIAVLEKLNVINLAGNNTAIKIEGPTPEQKAIEDKVNAERKQDFIENESKIGNPNASTPPAASIDLSAQKESNGTVTIFTKLMNVSSGKCYLTVVNNSLQTTQTAEVIYQSQYSMCAGFSVPISRLGNGSWDISLSVAQGGQTINKSITHEVK